jgi:hypothetical protein
MSTLKVNRAHPQPAVCIREDGEPGFELLDQRTGARIAVDATCFALRERCREIWPRYTFAWNFNYRGEATGTAQTVVVRLQ